MSYINFLIQLTEKDKRLIVALLIILIIIFVLVAYIGQGIKSLMRKYSKGIDGYMHELCSAKLVTNPRDFKKQVFRKETKVLYKNTRWILRVFIAFSVGFVIYTFTVKPGGEVAPFSYVFSNIKDLFIDFDWPKGDFFGFKNFPIDWPYVSKTPSPKFTVPSIVSYAMLIVWLVTFFGLFTSTLRFISRMNRANTKSKEVFTRSLDNASFAQE